jgi:hypothetical protein
MTKKTMLKEFAEEFPDAYELTRMLIFLNDHLYERKHDKRQLGGTSDQKR